MNMKKAVYLTSFIIFGLLIFYAAADFDNNHWQHLHGLWDKLKDFLLLLLIGSKFKRPIEQRVFFPALYLLLARVAWELLSWFTGWSINNHWAVSALFSLACIITLFYLIKRYRNGSNENYP
jgi:hypothetical protein